MELVDKENDTGTAFFRCLLYLVQDGLDTLLVLSLVLSAGHKRTHVKRKHSRKEGSRHIAIDNALRKALGDGSLANARLANQNGVILRPREASSQESDIAYGFGTTDNFTFCKGYG